MSPEFIIYVDRDGDVLSCVPESTRGHSTSDPVISVTRNYGSKNVSTQSVIFDNDKRFEIVIGLIRGLQFTEEDAVTLDRMIDEYIKEDR